MAAGSAPDAAPGHCLNCGSERRGAYCQRCGQRHVGGRLEVRMLWTEVASRWLERGLIRTLLDALRSPGGVIRRYVDGQRRRYASPFSYLLASVALTLLASALVRDDAELAEQIRANFAGQLATLLSEAQLDRFIELQVEIAHNTSVLILLICVPFALLMRLFFPSGALNLAEAFVFGLYVFGHGYFVALPTIGLFAVNEDLKLEAFLTIGLLVLMAGISAWGFFERRISAVLRTVIAFALAYVLFSSVMGTATMIYVVISVPGKGG